MASAPLSLWRSFYTSITTARFWLLFFFLLLVLLLLHSADEWCEGFVIISPIGHRRRPPLSPSSTTTTMKDDISSSNTQKRLLPDFEANTDDDPAFDGAETPPPRPPPTASKRRITETTTTSSSTAVKLDNETPLHAYLPLPVRMARSNTTKTNVTNTTTNRTGNVVVVTPKRADYLSWDDYFLAVAVLSSQRSKDGNMEDAEGACIVDHRYRIVAVGYSGFPRGCPDTVFPWQQEQQQQQQQQQKDQTQQHQDDSDEKPETSTTTTTNTTKVDWLHTKHPYVCHAITNAILNKCSPDVEGCRIYVMKFPSSDATKMIIQSGIKEVVILVPKNHHHHDHDNNNNSSNHRNQNDDVVRSVDAQAALTMLNLAGIEVRYHQPTLPSITLDFQHGGNVGTNTACTDACQKDGHQHDQSSPSSASTSASSSSSSSPSSPFTPEEQAAADILLQEANYDALSVKDNNGRRKDALSWNDYFMSVAFLTAQRSKDPNTQVGACIVDADRRIVGLGYNGMPSGLSDDTLPWARENYNDPLFNKYLYVTHAEVNAILNKGSADVKGSTLYVALFPCENCAKMIIQSGVRKVVYLKDSYHDTPGCTASRIMFKCARVELVQYTPSMDRLVIDY